MSPNLLSVWYALLDETPIGSKPVFKYNNYFLKKVLRDQSLFPLYKSAIRSNPYLLPYIEDFLRTLLYLNNLSESCNSSTIKAYNPSSTPESFKEAINSPQGDILYHSYITFYFYSIAHQDSARIKAIAITYKKDKNFNDYLTTGKAHYES